MHISVLKFLSSLCGCTVIFRNWMNWWRIFREGTPVLSIFNSIVWSRSQISAVTRLLSKYWLTECVSLLIVYLCVCVCLSIDAHVSHCVCRARTFYYVKWWFASKKNKLPIGWIVEMNIFIQALIVWSGLQLLVLISLLLVSLCLCMHLCTCTRWRWFDPQPTGQPGSLKASGTGLSSLQIIL